MRVTLIQRINWPTIQRFHKVWGPSMNHYQAILRWGLGLVACATSLASQGTAADKLSPPLNTESTAELGDEILHQGKVYQRAAIHLSREIKFGRSDEYALTPGYYLRTGHSDGWETYAATDGPGAGNVRKAPGAITLQGSFHYSNDGKTIGVITNFYQALNAEAKGITRTTRPALLADETQRLLVYGGMTGTKIRLGYREIWKNITRPSSDVFVEFDIRGSKIVELNGARIKVLDANSNSIRYRVMRAFDGKGNEDAVLGD